MIKIKEYYFAGIVNGYSVYVRRLKHHKGYKVKVFSSKEKVATFRIEM